MDERWVHCHFCRQTYAAGRGERCSLCGKTGGLMDVQRPAGPVGPDRSSWAPGADSQMGALPAAGCLGIMAGATLGLMIAFGFFNEVADPAAPVQAAPAGADCGLAAGLSGVFDTLGRFILGTVGGAIVGGVVAMIALILLTRLDRSAVADSRDQPGDEPATGPS